MEIQQLKYFVQAARRGSFREAADDLFVSRAALSKSMGRLEGELGYELFERNRDGVGLTSAGKRFYAQVAPLVEDYDHINQAVRAQQGVLEIELAIPNSWTAPFEKAIEAFGRTNPNVSVHLTSGPDAECNRRAQSGEADLVVSHIPLPNMLDEGKALVHAPLYVAMSERNPLAAKPEVTWDDMADQDIVCYSCGYEKVFWVPVAPGRSISYSNDLTHVYTRLFRNEGVMPTPLLTAPEYQQGIVYRPYRCPYDTVVMYGYIGPHVASDLQLQHACLALRDAMVLDPVE